MPPTEKHFETSLKRTGKDYAELHRWIDDPDNKNERHDFTRIWNFGPQIAAQFGEEGVREYIEHLREDMEKNSRSSDINTKTLCRRPRLTSASPQRRNDHGLPHRAKGHRPAPHRRHERDRP